MAELILRNVTKRYDGGVLAVSGVNLDIKNREFAVLVGPSGCGKSTTLRMIAGLEDVTEGDIFIDGLRVNDMPPKDRDIAMVFQNYALYPHMTVEENMAFGLKLLKLSGHEIKSRVYEAAEILGLQDYLASRPGSLSGGQRQRVAIGRVIVRKPKIFLFDEPLSNLDAQLRVQMRAEIIRLHVKLQATTVYVTHDQTEAMTMGSKIVVMNNKLVQQVGPPLEVYKKPVNRFVAEFIGSPSMNFLPAKAEHVCGGIFLDCGSFRLKLPKDKEAVVAPYAGRTIIIGIRPQDIYDRAVYQGKIEENTCEADIEVVEHLGAEEYVSFRAGSQTFTAKYDPSLVMHTGGGIRDVVFSMDRAVFFDMDTGAVLQA